MNEKVQHFYHEPTGTLSYLVWDGHTGKAAIIDPVLGFDAASGRTDTGFADEILKHADAKQLNIIWILETHAHADHLSAAHYLKNQTGARTGIGEGIRSVQEHFVQVFNLKDLSPDGSQFDHLFIDGEQLDLGELEVQVIHTPGHTADSVSYRVGESLFVGDTLFAPDLGSARTDFPGGSAATLYQSISRIFDLPGNTRIYLCHDYPPEGRELEVYHTIDEQKRANVHVSESTVEAAFVEIRETRDATLPMPKLILPSVQVNIRAGELPAKEDNGVSYLKVPVDLLGAGD